MGVMIPVFSVFLLICEVIFTLFYPSTDHIVSIKVTMASYRPVVIMHGVLNNSEGYNRLVEVQNSGIDTAQGQI